jgi:hypothetical protein
VEERNAEDSYGAYEEACIGEVVGVVTSNHPNDLDHGKTQLLWEKIGGLFKERYYSIQRGVHSGGTEQAQQEGKGQR